MIMMKRYKKILLTGVLSALSCSFVHAQELYKNENALCMNGNGFDFPFDGGREDQFCFVPLLPAFPVWVSINTIMAMKHCME